MTLRPDKLAERLQEHAAFFRRQRRLKAAEDCEAAATALLRERGAIAEYLREMESIYNLGEDKAPGKALGYAATLIEQGIAGHDIEEG